MSPNVLALVILGAAAIVVSPLVAEESVDPHPTRPRSISHPHTCSHTPEESIHVDVPGKLEEHVAALNLVLKREVTHRAVRSGSWSDPRTWQNGRLPAPNAKVHVPQCVAVEVDAMLDELELDWIRVDGRLGFRHDKDTAVKVRTLVIAPGGRLQVGSSKEPVREDVQARILFASRGERNRREDPIDLSGGLISHGEVHMFGARKTAHAAPRTRMTRGTDRLDFDQRPRAWRVGDRLLVPGTHMSRNQDEVRTIASIDDDGRRIRLGLALDFDHTAPSGVLIPVGNLTRNIELRSVTSAPNTARGHVMIMHVQTGTIIDGAAFVNLGRTDTRFAPTTPELGADGLTRTGTDTNTIARYALHFHVLSGARADVAPHVVRNSVVIGSPKYGIVNHGGHLVAEDNVTFRIAGAHLVAENGSEVGAFRRNLAVRSAGSGEAAVESRMGLYDFGHGGHGFWLQSSGVELTDNWAFGHARAGIFSMGMTFRENGKEVFFDARNLRSARNWGQIEWVRSADVDFHFARNTVASSGLGLEIWYHKLYSNRREPSLADGLTVWNVSESAVSVLYTRGVVLRNLRLIGSHRPAIPAVLSNALTEDISIEDSEIRDFAVGVSMAERGRNLVRNTTLANRVNLDIPVALVAGRQILLDHVSFDPTGYPDDVDIAMPGVGVRFGDLALLFQDDRIDLTDHDGRNYRLFSPIQHPEAIPFPIEGPEKMRGLTSEAIHRQFGLALGGALAPRDATGVARSNALATPSPLPGEASDKPTSSPVENYPLQTQHFAPPEDDGPSRWAISPPEQGGRGAIAYLGANPVKFMPRRGLLPFEIHPEDVSYGYLLAGVMLELVDERLTIRTVEREFHELKIDPDGFVRLAFQAPNMAGTELAFEVALRVTPSAVRRGPNVTFWSQRQFCGACGRDRLREDAERFYETGELAPLPRLVDACQRWESSAIVLDRPFQRETGHAYLARLPEVREIADTMETPHRSPFYLCEDDHIFGVAHAPHDSIRDLGGANFSHWYEHLYFSSADGSDPNTNGRNYFLVRPPIEEEDARPTGVFDG